MVKTWTRKEVRNLAKADFARGLSLNAIVAKYEIPKHTVKGWCERDGWGQCRQDFLTKQQETIFARFSQGIEEITEINLKTAKILAKVCYEMATEISSNGNYLNNLETLTKMFNIAKSCVSLPATIMPDLPNVIAEKILEELKDLKNLKTDDVD